MAKPELGAKRQCQSCATKFYDLNRDPIVCPKCGAIFHVAPLASRAPPPDDEEVEVEKEADVVSLDEVEAGEGKAEAVDVDEDGALLVRTEGGAVVRIVSGEVASAPAP